MPFYVVVTLQIARELVRELQAVFIFQCLSCPIAIMSRSINKND